jgi:cation transport protein ChaC
VTNVYIERIGKVQLADQSRVPAFCYVADLNHKQYAKNISVEKAVEIVRDSVGQSGHNIEYVTSTVEQLRSMDLKDHWLEDVVSKLPTKA